MQLRQIKNRLSRQPDRADPAHAFGSEEQLMEEFRRQNYVPPQPTRAGQILSGLKERIAAARQPLPEAPVYSAETFHQESAPDLGWETAFAPQEAAPPQPERPQPTASERFEAFRQTVYATPQPARQGPMGAQPNYGAFPPGAYYQQRSAAPIYQEISLQGGPRRQRELAKPVYEDLTFTRPRNPAPTPQAAANNAPAAQNAPAVKSQTAAGPQKATGQTAPMGSVFAQAAAAVAAQERPDVQTAQEAAPTLENTVPPEDPAEGFLSEGQLPEAGPAADPYAGAAQYAPPAPAVAKIRDWQYFCWSGSIVAGAALTFFGLIYACFI